MTIHRAKHAAHEIPSLLQKTVEKKETVIRVKQQGEHNNIQRNLKFGC